MFITRQRARKIALAAVVVSAVWVVGSGLPASAANGRTPVRFAASLSQSVSVATTPPHRKNIASTNQAGFAATTTDPSTYFVYGVGEWKVPKITCKGYSPKSEMSVWVGVGGTPATLGGAAGTLYQTGSDADCRGGHAHYDAFYEIEPGLNPVEMSSVDPNNHVSPGDVLFATVDVGNGEDGSAVGWGLQVTDLGSAADGADPLWTFDKESQLSGQTYPQGKSVECMVERDSVTDGSTSTLLPLAKFSPVRFIGNNACAGSWVQNQRDPGEQSGGIWPASTDPTPQPSSTLPSGTQWRYFLDKVNTKRKLVGLAKPSKYSSGTNFTVTWKRAK